MRDEYGFEWCEEHQCWCDELIEGEDPGVIFAEPDRYVCPECHREDAEAMYGDVYGGGE